METTVYVEPEKVSLISDPEAWQAKVMELGLAGQESLISSEKQVNPFLRMDAGLIRTFEALCPEKVEIEKFDAEPIPLEALGAYGLAVKEHYFGKVEVWYSPGQPDPAMVGTSGKEQFLLARWGPERLDLEGCRTLARQRWIARAKNKLADSIAEAQSQLNRLDSLADTHFSGGWTGIY